MTVLRLKEIMKEREISRDEIANALDVSSATISGISTGKVMPSIKFTLQLAEYLDVDIREMFNQTKGGVITHQELGESIALIEKGLEHLKRQQY